MLATIWTSQDIFGEKSWSGEWKKDNLRASPTIEKQSTGTFDSEIPSWACKLGKMYFLLFLFCVNHL